MSLVFPRVRKYHYATFVRKGGAISALCFTRPRAIDMRKATWTISAAAVNCQRCLKKMAETVTPFPTKSAR